MTAVHVRHDNKLLKAFTSENDAFAFLLHHQGQSVQYALEFGGYTITNEGDALAPASTLEWKIPFARGDGYGHILEMKIEDHDAVYPYETITHLPCSRIRELTWGISTNKRQRDESWTRSSNAAEFLNEWKAEPNNGWTLDELQQVFAIGNDWHLNSMNAACAHQEIVWETGNYGRQPSLKLTLPCRETGYRYGSAWLVRPLDPAIETTVTDIMEAHSDA